MSAPKHTPEPWSIHRHMGGTHEAECDGFTAWTSYIGAGDTLIGEVGAFKFNNPDNGGWLRVDSDKEQRANAARIVACVNACAGMDDPAAIISGLHIARETLLTVAKQRDELAAAAKRMISAWGHLNDEEISILELRAALAALEGKP